MYIRNSSNIPHTGKLDICIFMNSTYQISTAMPLKQITINAIWLACVVCHLVTVAGRYALLALKLNIHVWKIFIIIFVGAPNKSLSLHYYIGIYTICIIILSLYIVECTTFIRHFHMIIIINYLCETKRSNFRDL